MIPRTPIILPRGAGEGDRPKGGGRGALLASLLIQVKRKKGPHHHAEPVIGPATSGRTRWHGLPPPQSGGGCVSRCALPRALALGEARDAAVGLALPRAGRAVFCGGDRPGHCVYPITRWPRLCDRAAG